MHLFLIGRPSNPGVGHMCKGQLAVSSFMFQSSDHRRDGGVCEAGGSVYRVRPGAMAQETQGETTSFHHEFSSCETNNCQTRASPWEIAHVSAPEGSDWVGTSNTLKGRFGQKLSLGTIIPNTSQECLSGDCTNPAFHSVTCF